MLNINLIRENLIGKSFITGIYYFQEIDSTNNYAKKLENEDNVLIISEYQTAGKGRFGRMWESESGKNLTFTIKKKFNLSPDKNSAVNFFFSYFIYDCLNHFFKEDFENADTGSLQIKWPNDILIDGKKICGLLITSLLNKNDYIIGIGLNVNQRIFSRELNATSLRNFLNSEIELNNLLINIIRLIDKNLHLLNDSKFYEIYELWKSSTAMIGKSANFSEDGITYKPAKIINLAEDGSIQLLVNNEEKTYISSEVKITDIR